MHLKVGRWSYLNFRVVQLAFLALRRVKIMLYLPTPVFHSLHGEGDGNTNCPHGTVGNRVNNVMVKPAMRWKNVFLVVQKNIKKCCSSYRIFLNFLIGFNGSLSHNRFVDYIIDQLKDFNNGTKMFSKVQKWNNNIFFLTICHKWYHNDVLWKVTIINAETFLALNQGQDFIP